MTNKFTTMFTDVMILIMVLLSVGVMFYLDTMYSKWMWSLIQ